MTALLVSRPIPARAVGRAVGVPPNAPGRWDSGTLRLSGYPQIRSKVSSAVYGLFFFDPSESGTRQYLRPAHSVRSKELFECRRRHGH